jgi:N-acetyl sugar amidotransferase
METQVCTRCVMDDINDPVIHFNSDGTCNYCSDALKAIKNLSLPKEEGLSKLKQLFEKIKEDGKGKQYDCMMGLSGGLDSSYAAYLAYKHGLRVLLVHIDDGFDPPITTENINRICKTFSFDIIIEKPDKEQFADLTKAFILAGVPEIAIPQDNVLLAVLFKYAKKNNIKYFLSGGNYALEGINMLEIDAVDKVHIRDIHKRFGRVPLKNLPLFSIWEKRINYQFLYKIKMVMPLFYIDYNAAQAFSELNEICGYEYYGNKHWENRFTKFLLVYYLPKKFGIDKRKLHFSSKIVSGQMTRDEALKQLEEPLYNEVEMEKELAFVLDQLGISRNEFDKIMAEPPKKHSDYKTSSFNRTVLRILKIRKKLIGY